MAASIEVELEDDVSKNANAAAKSLKQLLQSINRVTAASKRSQSVFKRNRKSMADWRTNAVFASKATDRLRRRQGRLGKALDFVKGKLGLAGDGAIETRSNMQLLSAAGGAVAQGFAVAAGATVAAVGAFAKLSAIVTRSVVGMASFAEQSKLALGQVAGGAEQGAKEFKEITRLAVELGLDLKDTTKAFTKLRAQQFGTEISKDIIRMTADLKVLGTTSEEAQGIILTLGQVKAKGSLRTEELNQLNERGIATALVLESLEKKFGKSREEIQKMLSKGAIPAEKGIEAIGDAIRKKLHIDEFGEAAAKANKTLAGMAAIAKGRVQLALLEIGERALPKIQALMKEIDFAGFFDSRAFKLGVALVEGIFNAVVAGAKIAIPLVKRFVNNLSEGLEPIKPALDAMSQSFTALTANENFMIGLGAAVDLFSFAVVAATTVLTFLVTLFGNAVSRGLALLGMFRQGVDAVKAWASSLNIAGEASANLSGQVSGLGSAMIDGLVSAITSGAGRVADAIRGVMAGAVAAAKAELSIASPSKVFADIGVDMVLGAEKGLVNEGPRVAAATAGVVNPESLAALGPAAGANNLTANMGGAEINVQGARDPAETAIRVRDVLLDEFAGAFEQLNLEIGG